MKEFESDKIEVANVTSRMSLKPEGKITGAKRLGKGASPEKKSEQNLRLILISTANNLFLQKSFSTNHHLHSYEY